MSGWCGTTDNVSVHACGVAKITKIAKNGRLHIVKLNGDNEDAALEELGYPELKA